MTDRVRKATIANETLNNGFIKEAIEDIKKHCHKNIESSKHDEQEKREDMYYMLRAVDCFENILIKYINDGKQALSGINQTEIKRLKR